MSRRLARGFYWQRHLKSKKNEWELMESHVPKRQERRILRDGRRQGETLGKADKTFWAQQLEWTRILLAFQAAHRANF